jgi:hypothetical protein
MMRMLDRANALRLRWRPRGRGIIAQGFQYFMEFQSRQVMKRKKQELRAQTKALSRTYL